MSLFKFEELFGGTTFNTIEVDDSNRIPGALRVRCKNYAIARQVHLPREQVEKLVKVLNDWLGPPKEYAKRRSNV